MKYIYHHLGLGDHISCHGIVRHYCEIEDFVYLFVKPQNEVNVRRMYKDIKNIDFIVGDDDYAENFIKKNNIKNLIKIGFNKMNGHENFEKQFYNHAEVNIENKYDKFYVERDLNLEINIFESLGLEKDNYIFVHDGGFTLKNEFLPSDLRVVNPNNYGIFDWMYVIENAKEIHCIDSSFICLIDCMKLKNIKLYNHRYVRKYPEYIKLYPKKDWIFLN